MPCNFQSIDRIKKTRPKPRFFVNSRSNYFGKTVAGALVKLAGLVANGPSVMAGTINVPAAQVEGSRRLIIIRSKYVCTHTNANASGHPERISMDCSLIGFERV
jgi:hypothetical protein